MEAHRGSDTGWNPLWQSTEDLARYAGEHGASPARHGGEPGRARQRAAASVRQRCARIADRIRSSTEVMGGAAGPEQCAARRVPWLGLLLWMFACAALFVSLMMRPGDLDPDRRVAASSQPRAHGWELVLPHAFTRPASELRLFTVRRPPSH